MRDEETVVVVRPDTVRPADQRLAMSHIVRTIAFVALWMAIGVAFHVVRAKWHVKALDENAYLLVGVPLTIVWQLAVRRRPLLELWVDRWGNLARRSGPRIAIGVAVAALAAAFPIHALMKGWSDAGSAPQIVAWDVCAVAGALGVGYAASKLRGRDAGSIFGSLATAGVIGCGLMVLTTILRVYMIHQPLPHALPALRVAAKSFALYLPICFLLEEVTFRGLVDADVRDGRPIEGMAMAALSSILWGLWHVPTAPVHHALEFASVSILYPAIHVMVGIPLALWYRRSGNLLVPALTHAFIDAVRNGLLSSS